MDINSFLFSLDKAASNPANDFPGKHSNSFHDPLLNQQQRGSHQ